MPYSDNWGITITKTGAGVYAVSRLGVSGTVTLDHVFPNQQQENINLAGALAKACQFMSWERAAVGDGDLAQLWNARSRYATARWKLLAYARLILTSSGALRTAYQTKRDRWNNEEARERAELGTDA